MYTIDSSVEVFVIALLSGDCPLDLNSPQIRRQDTGVPQLCMYLFLLVLWRRMLCHGSGGYSPTYHFRGPGLRWGQSMCGLWRTKWHWDRLSSPGPSVFSCQYHSAVAFHTYHLGDEQVVVVQWKFHPIGMNNNNTYDNRGLGAVSE
jgi:hypothetical protein